MHVMDSLTVAATVHELRHLVVGSRIDRIHLPTAWEMVWILRGPGGARRLLFSARGVHARLHLTERRFENPAQPPAFCMLLRKHLEGARILRIEQPGLERVVQIVCTGRDELGDPTERALVAEITGKHANWLLLDRPWGNILGLLRPVSERESRERQLLPGLPYDPPPVPADRLDPGAFDPLSLPVGPGATDRPVREVLLARVHSLSRAALGELLAAAGIDPTLPACQLEVAARSRLAEVWGTFRKELAEGDFRLTRTAEGFEVLRLGRPGDSLPPGETLDAWFGARWDREAIERQRQHLHREVRERFDRLDSRRQALEGALERVDTAADWKLWGDLLLTFAHEVPRGVSSHVLPDIQSDDSRLVTIPLDPTLDATQNAQRHYRRYQKARSGEQVTRDLLAAASVERTYWEGVAVAIERATDLETLAEISHEVRPPVSLPGRQRTRSPEPRPLQLVSRDGITVWLGRNNRQNDWLTFKLARPEDWWFHARNIPGSHVLVRAEGQGELPERTLLDAAMLAAGFSQARMSSGVPVVYTRRKHVWKPSGALPGFVHYERERTVHVTPDADPLALFQVGASASRG
jgi:predicted ribosome quality control (RQC) complex YloA/Tae2 family protein